MKRFTAAIVLIGIASLGFFVASAAAQSGETEMTEAHIERIRSNCVEAQSTLNQLHASDALLRVNRGQLYEFISTKLMAPLNSRIALNRLDGASLISVSADYERQLSAFRLNYQAYEESMSALLKIKCTNQPVAFYDAVKATRQKREKVHESTTQLHTLIKLYKTEFETFAQKVEG